MNRQLFVVSVCVAGSVLLGCDKSTGAQQGGSGSEETRGESKPDARAEIAGDSGARPAEPEPEAGEVDGGGPKLDDPMKVASEVRWDHPLEYAKRTYVVALEPIPSGGFAALSQLTGAPEGTLALTMLDAQGEPQTHTVFEPVVESGEQDWGAPQFWGMAALSETSFVLIGDIETAPTEAREESGTRADSEGLVVRIDLLGGKPKTIWSVREEEMAHTSDVVRRADGTIAVLGHDAGTTTHLVAYTAAGIESWRKTDSSVSLRLAGELVALADGGLLVAGTKLAEGKWGETGLVMRVDPSGSEAWRTIIGNDEHEQVLKFAAPDGDGIAALFNDNERYRLVKVAPDGSVTADVTFGEGDGQTPVSFVRTAFGHVLVGGVDSTANGLQSRHYILSPSLELMGMRDADRVVTGEVVALPDGDVVVAAADPGMEAASRVIRLTAGK